MSEAMRVLLVEDNPGDARLIEEMLKESEAEEVELEWVKTLDEGVQRALQGGVDVLLLDLSLPDSKGLESVSTAHLFDTHLPIVVLTGLADEQAAFDALRMGAQDYLVKGEVDGETLLRTLRYARERAQVQDQLDADRGRPARAGAEVRIRALVCPTGGGLLPVLATYVQQLLAEDQRVLYVCMDRPAVVLQDALERHGIDATKVDFLDAAAGRRGSAPDGNIHDVDDPNDLDAVGLRIEQLCGDMGPRTHVLLDSVNSLLLHNGLDKVAGFVHYLANRLRLLQLPGDFICHQNQEWLLIADRFTSFLDEEVAAQAARVEGVEGDPDDPSIM